MDREASETLVGLSFTRRSLLGSVALRLDLHDCETAISLVTQSRVLFFVLKNAYITFLSICNVCFVIGIFREHGLRSISLQVPLFRE